MSIKLEKISFEVKNKIVSEVILNNVTLDFLNNKQIAMNDNEFQASFFSELIKSHSGKVIVLNSSIYEKFLSENNKEKLETGYIISQYLNLLYYMDVESNIFLPLYLNNKDITHDRRQKAFEYLNIFNLTKIHKKIITSISINEQKMISVIRGLVNEPKKIYQNKVDKKEIMQLINTLMEIQNIEKRSIIFMSHDKKQLRANDKKLDLIDGYIIL